MTATACDNARDDSIDCHIDGGNVDGTIIMPDIHESGEGSTRESLEKEGGEKAVGNKTHTTDQGTTLNEQKEKTKVNVSSLKGGKSKVVSKQGRKISGKTGLTHVL